MPIPQFLESLAEEAISKRKGFNPQNVANMLWAFAKLEYQPRCALVATLAEEALDKLDEFVSQNVSNMLWSFAKFGYTCSPRLLEASQHKISRNMHQFNPQVNLLIHSLTTYYATCTIWGSTTEPHLAIEYQS
jgi:hypothetical protein